MYNYQDFLKNNYMRGIYNNEDILENIYEGYSKGNAFKNLYDPYKNYKVKKLVPQNEQQDLFLKLSEVSFYAHEINLLLDVDPNNREMLKKFNEYRNMANNLINQYESKYGPINLNSNALNNYPFAWEKNNFPWDNSKGEGF